MTRDEFKNALTDLVDSVIDTDRELTDDDEDKLNDNFGETAQEIIDQAEASVTEEKDDSA